MSAPMHVAQFVDSLRIGGAEVVALNLARGLIVKGVTASVWGMGVDGPLRDRLASAGSGCHSFGAPDGIRPSVMAAVGRLLVQERVDVVVTHHFRQLFHALPAARLLGRKLVHVEHDYHFYQRDEVSLWRLRAMARFIGAFVGVSEEITDWFRDRIPHRRTAFVPVKNGVDVVRFNRSPTDRANIRAQLGLADGEFVIGTCARLEPVKNLTLLLDGFVLLAREWPQARLVIVGDGSCRQQLERHAGQLLLEERVIFAGLQADIQNFLAAFDVYAITSQNEGLPMSVLEAMAVGLPVVATNVGSLARVVLPSTGILLDDASPNCVRGAFGSLAKDPSMRAAMGEQARRIVVENYSVATMVDQYLEILEP